MGIAGPWVELAIQCAQVQQARIKGSAAVLVADESKDLPDAAFFDIHSETFQVDFNRAFETLIRVLKEQGDAVYRTDIDRGFIITGRARHGFLGFPIYEQYVIAIDDVTPTTSKITFKLFVHRRQMEGVPMTQLVLTPADRQFVYRRAAAFLDTLKRNLR